VRPTPAPSPSSRPRQRRPLPNGRCASRGRLSLRAERNLTVIGQEHREELLAAADALIEEARFDAGDAFAAYRAARDGLLADHVLRSWVVGDRRPPLLAPWRSGRGADDDALALLAGELAAPVNQEGDDDDEAEAEAG
jgi:hypothetical protein